jgi:hypothetical protein
MVFDLLLPFFSFPWNTKKTHIFIPFKDPDSATLMRDFGADTDCVDYERFNGSGAQRLCLPSFTRSLVELASMALLYSVQVPVGGMCWCACSLCVCGCVCILLNVQRPRSFLRKIAEEHLFEVGKERKDACTRIALSGLPH